MRYEVIIIGGGLGGLICGAVLSRAGKSVLVLERGLQAGGCIQSYQRGGLKYDTGFHYVGGLREGQSLNPFFKYLGLTTLPWHQLDRDGFDHVMIGGRNFLIAAGFDTFVKTMSEEFPEEKSGLQQYAEILRMCTGQESKHRHSIHQGPATIESLMQIGAYQYLTQTFRDPLLINVLSGNSIKMELRRDTLPLFTFAHCNAPYIESSWRLKGDGGMIVRKLVDTILSNGGEVKCRADVAELEVSAGRIKLAKLQNGAIYEGHSFVSSLHPVMTCSLVKSGLKNTFRQRVEGLENTIGMLTVSLRMKPQRVPYFNYNQYVYRKPNVWTHTEDVGGIGGVMVSCRVPERGLWAEQIDLITPISWQSCEPWSNTTTGHRPMSYERMKRKLADECILLAERFIPELSYKYDRRYISTPLTYRDYTATPLGSAYGIRKDFHNPVMTMLSPRTPIPNLYLTGQSLMLHGVQGVTETAFETCSELLGKEYIDKILKL